MGNAVFSKTVDYSHPQDKESDNWPFSKIGDYTSEGWVRMKAKAPQLGFDQCTRCLSPVLLSFYCGNCFGIHDNEHLKQVKLNVFAKYQTHHELDIENGCHVNDVLKISMVSCTWEAAVVQLKLKSGEDETVHNRILFYSNKKDTLIGEYHIPDDRAVVEVYVSPSGRTFIIHEAHEMTDPHTTPGREKTYSTLKCVSFEDGMVPVMLDQVTDLSSGQNEKAMIAFDPRFGHSRIACYVPKADNLDSHSHGSQLLLYDLDEHRVLLSTSLSINCPQNQHRVLVSYNPEGTLLTVLLNHHLKDEIRIYDSDTLTCLCRLPCYFTANDMLCNFPAFSMCGSYISVPNKTGSGNCVQVYKITKCMPSLQTICRTSLLRFMHQQEFHKLPLPKQLITFLTFGYTWE